MEIKRSTVAEAITALRMADGQTDNTTVCQLTLPGDTAVTNVASNLIQITYKLKVSVRVTETKFIHSRILVLRFPIVIGTFRSSLDANWARVWRDPNSTALYPLEDDLDDEYMHECLPDYDYTVDSNGQPVISSSMDPPSYAASMTSAGLSGSWPAEPVSHFDDYSDLSLSLRYNGSTDYLQRSATSDNSYVRSGGSRSSANLNGGTVDFTSSYNRTRIRNFSSTAPLNGL